MFICYVCSKKFVSHNGLFLHFKIVHNLQSDSIYRCRQGICRRDFQSTHSFRKHLWENHKENTSYNTSSNTTSNISNPDANFFKLSSNSTTDKVVDAFENFEDILQNCVLQFLAKLYNHSAIPRNVIQIIVEECTHFFNSELMNLLNNLVIDELQSCPHHKEKVSTIATYFKKIKNPFNGYSSEYLRIKALSISKCYIPPQEYKIGHRIVETIKNGNKVLEVKDVNATLIPLRLVLKRLFELPNAYEKFLGFLTEKNTKLVSNFAQSEFWEKKKLCFGDKLVFPLFLYYDDYESCNPLGSHAGVYKIGAVYISLPFLPAELQGSLDRILLFQLHHSQDRKEFGNKAIFEPVAQELKFLEENGIVIETSTGTHHIYFCLALLIGDNLALHTMLGFSESFSGNFPCRFCHIHKSDLKSCYSQSDDLLRNRVSYEADLRINNLSLTGVKEPCIWNCLNFHVSENLSVDIMHDILEGVCHYDFIVLLKRFITDMKYFTLENLNFRIKTFNYSDLECKNKPSSIGEDDFLKKSKLKMSASEMLCFTRYFGLFVGDLIPVADEGWQLYLNLREIIDIIFSRSVSEQKINILKVLVEEHHRLYLSSTFKSYLRPKHHHMVHYPLIMSKVGPLRNLWSMRFESKHKESKTTANITTSRKNITLTLSIKHQLKLCHKLLAKTLYDTITFVGPGEIIHLNALCHYNLFKVFLPSNLKETFCPHWVNIYGLLFKPSSVIITGSNLLPTFGEILYIIEIEQKINYVYRC